MSEGGSFVCVEAESIEMLKGRYGVQTDQVKT
jgi:hypothetical protein